MSDMKNDWLDEIMSEKPPREQAADATKELEDGEFVISLSIPRGEVVPVILTDLPGSMRPIMLPVLLTVGAGLAMHEVFECSYPHYWRGLANRMVKRYRQTMKMVQEAVLEERRKEEHGEA